MNKPILPKLFYCFIFALLSGYNGYTQNIDFGKSYVNITKGLNGGTVEPGDTLEIRAVFVVRAGFYDSCGFFDIIPTGTAYIPGTIRVLTNEGKIYKQFTDALNDDEGWISGSNIRINMGYNQADAPIDAADVDSNLILPATVEKHYALGADYRMSKFWDLGFHYSKGSQNTLDTSNPLSRASIGLEIVTFGINLGYRF